MDEQPEEQWLRRTVTATEGNLTTVTTEFSDELVRIANEMDLEAHYKVALDSLHSGE